MGVIWSNFSKYSEVYSTREVRLPFTRKVYGLVSFQLIIIYSFIFTANHFKDELSGWIAAYGTWIFWVCWALSLLLLITLAFFESLRRGFPQNLASLVLFTLLQAVSQGFSPYQFNGVALLDIIIIMLGILFILMLFTFQSKIELTVYPQLAFIAISYPLACALLFSFFKSFCHHLLVPAFGGLVLSILVVIDTQLVLSGNKEEIGPHEVILATINIYLDAIFFIFKAIKKVFVRKT